MKFVAAGRHGLRHLFDFSGRDAPSTFWFWVLWLVLAQQVFGLLLVGPLFLGMFNRIERFAAEHPDQATVTHGPGTYSIQVHGAHPELMPDFEPFIWIIAAFSTLIVLLLAAAVARRLHDRGKVGWWGLMPVPFLASATVGMERLFSNFSDQTRGAALDDAFLHAFGFMMINNGLYLITLIVLIVMLAQAGEAGSNRYGPPPA